MSAALPGPLYVLRRGNDCRLWSPLGLYIVESAEGTASWAEKCRRVAEGMRTVLDDPAHPLHRETVDWVIEATRDYLMDPES